MVNEKVDKQPRRHDGRNVQRVRVYLGVKQEALAIDLKMSQQKISIIEQQEEIDDHLLKQIGESLGVSADVIRNFDEEKSIYNINNIRDNSFAEGAFSIAQQFNPLEKIIELYERLLKSEREKLDLLSKDSNLSSERKKEIKT